jgi:hypothetical protein
MDRTPERTRSRGGLGKNFVLVVAVLTAISLVGVQGGAAAGSRGGATHRPEDGSGGRRMLSGVVDGDGAPRAGYEVTLFASRVVGRSRVSLLGSSTTDAAGRFRIPYELRHRALGFGPVLYVLAERGDAMLASAVGHLARYARIVIDERTTVAIGTAFAQFVDGRAITGNTFGMRNAVAMAADMADPKTGQIGTVLDEVPNGGATSTRATFNTLANIVASCVGEDANCQSLFAASTPAGVPTPTTVLQAIANMTKYPSNDIGGAFALASGGPYAPALTEAPTSWLLFLKFTGGAYDQYDASNLMSGPGNIAFDRRGTAWINDNYVPTAEPHIGCAGLRLLKLHPWGEPYRGSPFYGGGLSGAGFGITLDPRGRVWVGNFGFEAPACDGLLPPDPANKIPATHDSVSLFRPDGTPISRSQGFTQGHIWWPQATVSDPKGNVWVANCGNDTVTYIPRGRHEKARNIPLPGGLGAAGHYRPSYPQFQPQIKPFAIAVDPQGRAWVTGNRASEVYVISPDGTVKTVDTGGLLSWPMGISTDSHGNMWVSNSDAVNVPCVTPLDRMQGTDPSVVLIPADGSTPTKHYVGGLTIPWGNVIDGSDTLWVFNFGANPTVDIDESTIWPDTGVSRFCGADARGCPPGKGPGDPISPPVGYTSDALDRVTGGGVDRSGNLWLLNNWKKNGPLGPIYDTNPGGNSFVIVPGAATPVHTPVLGPPVPFGAP